MRRMGFSTGALAKSDFREALRQLTSFEVSAIELSALRDTELSGLMAALPELDLHRFDYISVHAPSKFESVREADASAMLRPCIDRGWSVILHPDAIRN